MWTRRHQAGMVDIYARTKTLKRCPDFRISSVEIVLTVSIALDCVIKIETLIENESHPVWIVDHLPVRRDLADRRRRRRESGWGPYQRGCEHE